MTLRTTYRDFPKISAKEQRIAFVDSGSDRSQSSADESGSQSINWREHGSFAAYKNFIDKQVDKGALKKEKANIHLKNAKDWFDEQAKKEKDLVNREKILERIKEIRKKKKEKVRIAKEVARQYEEGYIDGYREIREAVRNEIELLGIPLVEEDEQIVKEYTEFEQEIFTSITQLLDQKGIKMVEDGLKRDQELARYCYQKARKLLTNEENLVFVKFLATKELPASEKMDIKTILDFSTSMEGRWDQNTTLVGIVKSRNLRMLKQSLDAVDMLREKWQKEVALEKSSLIRDLNNYKKDVDKAKSSTMVLLEAGDVARLRDRWNEDFFNRKHNDLEKLRELLNKDDSEPNRRLVQAFLGGSSEEIEKIQKELKELHTAQASKETPKTTSDDAGGEVAQTGDKGSAEHHEEHGHGHGHPRVEKIAKTLKNVFTLNGNIVWYSFYDIQESFKLIKESWHKHIESVSEDKRGGLAEGIMFWKPEVARRIGEQDRIAEKGRAEERKKHYQHAEHDDMVAELADWPAKDKRRAILEVIAERGNLKMSDRKLVNAVCKRVHKFEDKEWDAADIGADYTPMREFFKKAVDGDFVGEIGYAQKLLDMQTSGNDSAIESGKRLAAAYESSSTTAEVNMFDIQRKHSLREGEGKIVGIIEKMVGRANTYSNNGSFQTIEVNGGKDKVKDSIYANSDLGLVGLMVIDSFVQKKISRENLAAMGKLHESGFNPYSTFADSIAERQKTDCHGKKVSCFEYWGWLKEGKDGQPGEITDLGKTEIIKWFNTRNALAKIERKDGGFDERYVRIELDDKTYERHSRRHGNVREITKAGITVGDKVVSYLVKGANREFFHTSAKKRVGGSGGMVGEIDQLASLIKSGVEDFVDAAEMIAKPERDRYIDSYDFVEIDHKTGKRVDGEKIIGKEVSYGRERLERAQYILTRVMKNFADYNIDRSILRPNGQFKYHDRDPITGLAKKGEKSRSLALEDYLRTNLKKYQHTHPAEYNAVMQALGYLQDESNIPTPEEASERGVKSKQV